MHIVQNGQSVNITNVGTRSTYTPHSEYGVPHPIASTAAARRQRNQFYALVNIPVVVRMHARRTELHFVMG